MILALDLATSTGYAINGPNKLVAGTVVLATAAALRAAKITRFDRRIDIRVVALFEWVKEMIRAWSPSVVVFEDVKFASSQAQAHLWASLRAAVWCACDELRKPNELRIDCLDVQKLKIFATGNGAATKEMMAAALTKREPQEFIQYANGMMQISSHQILDDNAIDAIHLLRWAQSVYEKVK